MNAATITLVIGVVTGAITVVIGALLIAGAMLAYLYR